MWDKFLNFISGFFVVFVLLRCLIIVWCGVFLMNLGFVIVLFVIVFIVLMKWFSVFKFFILVGLIMSDWLNVSGKYMVGVCIL